MQDDICFNKSEVYIKENTHTNFMKIFVWVHPNFMVRHFHLCDLFWNKTNSWESPTPMQISLSVSNKQIQTLNFHDLTKIILRQPGTGGVFYYYCRFFVC